VRCREASPGRPNQAVGQHRGLRRPTRRPAPGPCRPPPGTGLRPGRRKEASLPPQAGFLSGRTGRGSPRRSFPEPRMNAAGRLWRGTPLRAAQHHDWPAKQAVSSSGSRAGRASPECLRRRVLPG
jgi:hypothetical protein